MKYGDFCLKVESYFAKLQRMFNTLNIPEDVDKDKFSESCSDAIIACMELDAKIKDEFAQYYED